jgi:hypothetical protein
MFWCMLQLGRRSLLADLNQEKIRITGGQSKKVPMVGKEKNPLPYIVKIIY